MPLHYAIDNQAGLEVVKALLHVCSEAANKCDNVS